MIMAEQARMLAKLRKSLDGDSMAIEKFEASYGARIAGYEASLRPAEGAAPMPLAVASNIVLRTPEPNYHEQRHDLGALSNSEVEAEIAPERYQEHPVSIQREPWLRDKFVPLPARISVGEVAAQLNDRIADLTRELLGEPNAALSSKSQLRYGTKGSVAI
jgi:hypothetical protein